MKAVREFQKSLCPKSPPAMSTAHTLSLTSSSLFKLSHFRPKSQTFSQTLGFCVPNSLRFVGPSSKSRSSSSFSVEPRLSDADEVYGNEDDDEEEDDEEDDDVAADEYDEFSGDEGFDRSDEEEVEVEAESSFSDAAEAPSRSEDFKWQRVEKLRSDVRVFGDQIIDVDELASIYDFRIDKFQRLAVKAFLNGSSVVVSAPTSSGKTLIAEAAAVATIARGRRLFYTTPLKALSNQKFREFRETFGESNVGLLTGDSAVNKDAQILIMTTEILRNMLYQSVGAVSSGDSLFHVDVIVLDEVHYLSDISRGTVWEEIVIYCPKKVQLICLSATVANPEELAGWIGKIHGKTELVTSSKRPVPLTWHFSTKPSLLPLLDESGSRLNRKLSLNYLQLNSSALRSSRDDVRRKNSRRHTNGPSYDDTSYSSEQPLSKSDINAIRRSQVPRTTDTLWQLKTRDMLPAVWFIFSRKGCDAAVQYLEDYYDLLDDRESAEVESALRIFRNKHPDAVRQSSVKGIRKGVAAHHAGCLPLWKSFIEELFQRGLIKVVFATETLAAGINMPARTAVVSALSKRSESGRSELSPNELLQMAGRAGRRGIDDKGHVVLVQSNYEGAEEGHKILSSGLEPLVSQFTASYGMVLNLLAGSGSGLGRSLEEARKLVEQSFGNYLSSNVVIAAKEEIAKIKEEIEALSQELTDEAIDEKSKKLLSAAAYKEINDLQEELRELKRVRTELRREMESVKISSLRPLLEESENGQLPFICLRYTDPEGAQIAVSALYLVQVNSLDGSKLKNLVSENENFLLNREGKESGLEPSYHVALGSDNSWYLFTEKWLKSVYKTGFPNVSFSRGEPLPRESMKTLLDKEDPKWEKLSDSELGGVWLAEGSMETWTWSLNVPVLTSLAEDDDDELLLTRSEPYRDSVERYKEQRSKVARLKKKITRVEGFREYKKILESAKLTEEKIRRLKSRSTRLTNRVDQIEPSGWREFLRISDVIRETGALDLTTGEIFPLGETAAAIRGENELWLATVLRDEVLLGLKPAELAAVLASLVSEGIKLRPWKSNSYVYESTATVLRVIEELNGPREALMEIQERHRVEIPCGLDGQFSGMVEAWASGLTWREMMKDCAMDEGDLARLLRRTVDILAQVPKLPGPDRGLKRIAREAAEVMDRPPISELVG